MTIYQSAALALLFAALPASTFAQGEQGRIAGIVRDQSGAFVADAKVTVKNEKTGEDADRHEQWTGLLRRQLAETGDLHRQSREGRFRRPSSTPRCRWPSGQELTLDFELKHAGVQEQVTVVGTAPILDMSSANIGASVSEREVQGLPVNGRQMSQLMLQAPGSQNAGTGTWGDIRFSGRAVEQNVIKYDGVEASGIIDSAPGVANGENASLFKLQASLENVQEFRVESSGYPAEFGTGTGGQVSVITKSGGNTFHGSVFEYLRSDELDAANYFDSQRNADGSVIAEAGSAPTVPKSPLKLNQFGGSIGGPLMKDRAFFFGSYEGYRLDAGKNFIQGAPSAAAWARAVPAIAGAASRVHRRRTRTSFRARRPTRTWTSTSGRRRRTSAKTRSARRLDVEDQRQVVDRTCRVFHDQAESLDPQDVSGRLFHMHINPTNADLQPAGPSRQRHDQRVQGRLQQRAEQRRRGHPGRVREHRDQPDRHRSPTRASPARERLHAGHARRTRPRQQRRQRPRRAVQSVLADVRRSAQPRGRAIICSRLGADVRLIRMSTDQLGGITYTYPERHGVPGQPADVGPVLRRPERAEPVPQRRDRPEAHRAGVLRRLRAGRMARPAEFHAQLRPPLRLLRAAPGNRQPRRQVQHRHRQIDPDTTPFYKSKKNNFQPRLSAHLHRDVEDRRQGRRRRLRRSGPDRRPDSADRSRTHQHDGDAAVRCSLTRWTPALIRANFINNPNNRSYQPRAYADDYTLPEKVYQYTASVQQELGGRMAASVGLRRQPGTEPVPPQHHQPDCRRAVERRGGGHGQVREFAIVTCANGTSGTGILCPGSTISSVQNPYAEIDYKTSGGTTATTLMQLALTRRSSHGVALNGQYTLGLQQGHDGWVERGERRRATRRASRERPANRTITPIGTTTTATTTSTCATRSISARSTRSPARRAQWRLVGRRHRQRAQRPADRGAGRAQRRRLRGRGGQHVPQPRGGSHRRGQHARRRRQPQRAASGSRVRRRPVHRRTAGSSS